MKERKKRNGVIAVLLTVMFMMSFISIPVQQVQAVSPETGGDSAVPVTKVESDLETYTVSLDLAGGTQADLEAEGWVQTGDQWVQSLTEENPGEGVTLSVSAPERSGFQFTGWLVSGTDETIQQLSDYSVSQDTTFTATWQEQTALETTPDVSDPPEEDESGNSGKTDDTGDDDTGDIDNANGNDDIGGDIKDIEDADGTYENELLTTPGNSAPSDTDPDGVPPVEAQTYTVQLDLDGWSLPADWNPGEGWTVKSDGVWSYEPAEDPSGTVALLDGQDAVIFRLPTLTGKEAEFPGWTVLSPNDGTVSIQQDDKGDYLSLPVGNPCAVQLQVRAESKYNIVFTNAEYQHQIGVQSTNTVSFSHVNANYPDMTIEDVLEFLNTYVSNLKLDYTITYTDATGVQQTVTRSGVIVQIDWTQQNADFRDIVDTQLAAMDGTVSKVRLNEEYLKKLILAHEQTVAQAEALPDAATLTEQDITFPDWGTLDETQGIYTGGNADKLGLNIQIGVSQNKNTEISENKENYTIETVSPGNVTLNLFDYWLSDPAYTDVGDTTAGTLYPFGINDGHGLVFFKNGAAGTWNIWTGAKAAPRADIVKNELDGNGYPVLNLSETFKASGSFGDNYTPYNPEESLQYLFDPDMLNTSGNGKAYSDVTGLFKVDENGNYYFSSHDNFAEFDPTSNSFNVYNTWGVKQSGTSPQGQFFPFNTVDQVFDLDSNGNLVQATGITATNTMINHYLGLTMTAEFQQPINGMVSVGANARPMVFEFSGDDDVWIFIDDVLVADLGGIHDEASVEIDFSTGEVTTYLAANPDQNRKVTTLKEIFSAAGKSTDTFNGDTFGNNTTHTLKMFYLERGNYDSNLTLSFNLMEPASNTLIKLDQNGEPIEGAEFSIYPAKWDDAQSKYVIDGEAVETIITNQNGTAQLSDYDFSQHDYYILKEIKTPDGYFSPGEVVLRYDKFEKHPDGTTSGTNLLMVENRWDTGAVSNFSASVYQAGTLKYDNQDPIDSETGAKGLILAVPLLKGSDGEWYPLYGSNMVGFHDVAYETAENKTDNQRRAVLEAALYQIYGAQYQKQDNDPYDYGFPEWYLEWNAVSGRYEGKLIDLPGDASRYYWASNDENADLSMAYYFLDLDALKDLFGDLTGKTSEEKLQGIADTIDAGLDAAQAGNITSEAVQKRVEELVTEIDQANVDGKYTNFALLDVSDFNRVFSSRIYVPNVSPELAVVKLDEEGNPLKGATFALYKSESEPTAEAVPEAIGTTDDNGTIVFSASGTGESGSAHVIFENGYYWVKETGTPTGYQGNETYIPVYVAENGRVYADALEENDGITVRKGLGRLLETMVRYAAEDSVNVTLRDITATLVTADTWADIGKAVQIGDGDGSDGSSTTATGPELHLHYGLDNALLEYGTHEVNGVTPNPYFEVDEDIAGIQVQQAYDAHEDDILYSSVVDKIDLEDANIRSLFTGSTAIVVRNRKTDSSGAFSVAKTVTGSDVSEGAEFLFDVEISGELDANDSWDGNTTYTVTQETEESQDTQEPQTETLQTGKLTFTKDAEGNWKITAVTPDGTGASTAYFQEQNGTYRLKLQDGQKISVTGVPFGLEVTVSETEDSSDGYITMFSINNGDLNDGTTADGVVEVQVGNPSFHFYNNKDKVANLTLEKFLPEETTSTEKFDFTVTLNSSDGGSSLTGTYNYTITDKSGTVTSGEFSNGRLNVELGHDDQLVIQDLPVGTRYVIRETTNGYTPAVTIDGNDTTAVDGQVTGTVKEVADGTEDPNATPNPNLNTVVYSNTRSGSITITKRNGQGNLLSGAGFTLYTVEGDQKTPVGTEHLTKLALRCEIDTPTTDDNFDPETMRYTVGDKSYVVHKTQENNYFYYRFLTEEEISQYYQGKLPDADKVEAIVQFTGLALNKTYAIDETTVPDGYVQNADMEEEMSSITLPQGDDNNKVYDILYTVTNHEQMVLPVTGLGGLKGPLAAGLLLMVLAGALLWVANRKTGAAGVKAKRHP